MRAEILSIGTEILLGHITDTNAPYLARHLSELGIDLYFVSQVGDNRQRVAETLRRAWERADLVITTGGLGPTEDDVTREAICDLLGETPIIDEDYLANLRAYFAMRGIVMPESNVKQAWLIPSATALANPIGTAPGWFVERDGKIVVAMPGVPREMYRMWEREATPRLVGRSGATLVTRILRVTGLGESNVEERLGNLIHLTNPTVATYAKYDAVDVRVSAKAPTAVDAEALLEPVVAQARALLGDHVFADGTKSLAAVAGDALDARGWSIASMESCTGGALALALTQEPGSSKRMRGGLVTYATEAKVAFGVPQETIDAAGVISDAVALAMARAACDHLSADVGVGITGVAGPDPQDGHHPGEVHVAVVTPTSESTRTMRFRGERGEIQQRATLAALDLVRREAKG